MPVTHEQLIEAFKAAEAAALAADTLIFYHAD